MNETMEKRFHAEVECRAASDGSGDLILAGYAAVFDVETERWPGFREVFRRGAFAESLQNSDVLALWMHDYSQPLGRKSGGTLTLEEDSHGLRVEIRMANTVINQNRYSDVQRGTVKGMSIGFIAHPDGQRFSSLVNGAELRELTRVNLLEVSPHSDPQYTETSIEARAKVDAQRPKQAEKPAEVPVEVQHAQARAVLMASEL